MKIPTSSKIQLEYLHIIAVATKNIVKVWSNVISQDIRY
jgi:hypothetical protein